MRFIMNSGDTVRLSAVFKDWAGDLVNPDNVRVKIYDARQQEVTSAYLGEQNRSSLGHYFWFYTPQIEGFFIYEFSGELDGNTVLRRRDCEVKFVI